MYNCDAILQRLSQYLDGQLPQSELSALRQQAATRPECQALFDAMLWAHQELEKAPMLEPPRDFQVSVIQELAWRQRRDKILLGGILLLAVFMALAPLLVLLWAGLAAILQPGWLQSAIVWLMEGISDIAAYGVAILALIQHLPQWATILTSTFLSLSLLLLALMLVMQKAPEQLFTSSETHRQTA